MALYRYVCLDCKIKRYRDVDSTKAERPRCPRCSSRMERSPKGPGVQAKETLDNGSMSKSVERYVDAEELFRERSQRDLRERKGD